MESNMSKPAISVIVPIYNMEELMRKCLDSIAAQTFQDYECLLVDDGSTDGSSAICDEYAAKDNRFIAFHKPNGGLSDARNYGLAHSQGVFSIFFDPDDWVDADCLKDMYAKAQEMNADLVMCDIFYNDPYRQTYSKQEPRDLNHYTVLEDVIRDNIQGFTVIKLIRKSLYEQYNLMYPIGMYGCEDQYTMCALLKHDIEIAYLPKAYYHYMHYGNHTQSRCYDENTFLQDVKIRDMFVQLLADTSFQELAWEKKTFAIFYRAFHYGKKYYTSKKFKQFFSDYLPLIKEFATSFKWLYVLSINGHYQFARFLFQLGYNAKQFYKRLLA